MDTPVTRHGAHLRRGLAALAVLTVLVLGVVLVVAASSRGGSGPSEPVLGSPAFMAPYGEGWGTPHREMVFNGGDPGDRPRSCAGRTG